jgi:ribosomal protein S27AE
MEELIGLVVDFRARLEQYDQDHGLTLQSFPNGACGDASILLAHHLALHGFGPYRYVCGRHGDASHVWLTAGDVIIDITADQFADFDEPVFVAVLSSWHEALAGVDQHEAKIDVWGEDWEQRFLTAYGALTKE